MTLEQLRARLREKHGALAPLREKAFAEGAAAADLEAFDNVLKECEAIEGQIAMAEREEALAAKATKTATAPTGETEETRPAAQRVEVKELGQKLSLVAAGIVIAGKSGDPMQVLTDHGYQGLVDELKTHANHGKAVNTGVSSEGGILVPTSLQGGILPLLRAESTFLNAGPTRVQLVNGSFKQPRGATGATASYVAEGALKPVSTPTFDAIDMKAKKLAGIVPITNEARKWTIGNLEAYIRDDLRNALALTMDVNAYLGTGSGSSPVGILNKPGIQTVTGTFASATAPTLAELDALANAAILKLTTANIYANPRWRWVMSYRTAMFLATVRTSGGDLAYPEMDLGRDGGPRWKGFPVIVTNQVPTNLGTGTDETLISLVDFTHVLFGEEEGIVMKMSDQATLDPDGTGENLLHLFQQNMFAILAETEHDFGLRYAKAVVKATGIRF
jgi:HK97 family phage major capsid protein